ncbi:aldo/keto reductase [Eubacterium sp. 1001713B170207_170306_E7]|uniref:aldo/keto reductase n=1 Tax=Eubacterium sp. 1001713B170207_170306_E7 TaxID=2787097 RepID=UPI0018989C48|nr:aldo/keto reductase [Eubacterium sp. 1001713B170207_170306_E7]
MEYRKLPRGTEKISIIGIGTSSIGQAGDKEAASTAALALENGVNFFDMASADAEPFAAFGRVMEGVREQVYLQIHFGADYQTGKYGWTLDPDAIKRSVEWQLKALKTDYIDFGFIHCIDEAADLERIITGGVLEQIQALKKAGVVRHIGLSSHTPEIAHKMLDSRLIDMLMFSINPGYDYRHGAYAIGSVDERIALYQRCEAEGVGISVMKAFSGGRLLDASLSPFKRALSEYQCIQYALDTPGVLTVLPGVRNSSDMRRILGFLKATPEEKDYSILGSFAPQDAEGVCVYCNHCQPCHEGLDVALINKYYDLSRAGDSLAESHYFNLEKKASDCIACGHCNNRCPFKVDQVARMKAIQNYFGE